MRIRIQKPIAGVIDGVSLDRLELGGTYDVEESLGGYLVTIRAAEEVFSPKLARTMDEDGGFPSSMFDGGVTIVQTRNKPQADKHSESPDTDRPNGGKVN